MVTDTLVIEDVMIEASEAAVMAEGTFRKNKIQFSCSKVNMTSL